jgi:hypothetical protein
MEFDVTSWTGLLLVGSRAQVDCWSIPSTHRSWKVAWPIAVPAKALMPTKTRVLFIAVKCGKLRLLEVSGVSSRFSNALYTSDSKTSTVVRLAWNLEGLRR